MERQTNMELQRAIELLSDETAICQALIARANPEDNQVILRGRSVAQGFKLRGDVIPEALNPQQAEAILTAARLVESSGG